MGRTTNSVQQSSDDRRQPGLSGIVPGVLWCITPPVHSDVSTPSMLSLPKIVGTASKVYVYLRWNWLLEQHHRCTSTKLRALWCGVVSTRNVENQICKTDQWGCCTPSSTLLPSNKRTIINTTANYAAQQSSVTSLCMPKRLSENLERPEISSSKVHP